MWRGAAGRVFVCGEECGLAGPSPEFVMLARGRGSKILGTADFLRRRNPPTLPPNIQDTDAIVGRIGCTKLNTRGCPRRGRTRLANRNSMNADSLRIAFALETWANIETRGTVQGPAEGKRGGARCDQTHDRLTENHAPRVKRGGQQERRRWLAGSTIGHTINAQVPSQCAFTAPGPDAGAQRARNKQKPCV